MRAVHDQRRAAHLAAGQSLDGAELLEVVVESGPQEIETRNAGHEPAQVGELLRRGEDVGPDALPIRAAQGALGLEQLTHGEPRKASHDLALEPHDGPAGEEPDGQVGELGLVGLGDGDLEDERPHAVGMARRELDGARPAAGDGVDGCGVDREHIQQRGHGIGLLRERPTGSDGRAEVAGARRRDGPEAGRLERFPEDARGMPSRRAVEEHDVGGLAAPRELDGPARGLDHLRGRVVRLGHRSPPGPGTGAGRHGSKVHVRGSRPGSAFASSTTTLGVSSCR